MPRLESRDTRPEEAAAKAEIPYEVEQFVPRAFIRETEPDIAQIPFRSDSQTGLAHQGGKGVHLGLRGGRIHYDDGVVNVAALYEPHRCKALHFMEEDEGAARRNLAGIIAAFLPVNRLHSRNAGSKIHRKVAGEALRRLPQSWH